MSQKRFRERQKVSRPPVMKFYCNRHGNMARLTKHMPLQAQAQTLEQELAHTAAQLEQVHKVKAALESKNQLLERLLQMTKKADMRSCPELPTTDAVSHASLQ